MSSKVLGTQERRVIFADLVSVQDAQTMTVSESRKVIAGRYAISLEYLRKIEDEGIDRDWPPLTPPGSDPQAPPTLFPFGAYRARFAR